MDRVFAILLAVALAMGVMWGAPSWSAPSPSPPLEAYGRLPNLEHVQISPDGARLAMITSSDELRQLQVRNVSDRKLLAGVNVGKVKVRNLDWAGPHHILITTSSTAIVMFLEGPQREYMMVTDYDVDRHHLRPLMEPKNEALNTVQSFPITLMLNGKPVVFLQGISFPEHRGVLTLYRSELDSGRFTELAVGTEETQDFLVDAKGEPFARSEYNERSGRYSIRVNANGHWTERRAETDPIDHPELEGIGRDGKSVLVAAFHGERYELHELAPDGGWSDALRLDYDELVFDPASRALLGAANVGETHTQYTFFSPADQSAWDAVAKAFKGEEVRLSSWSDDRKRLVVEVAGASFGYAYYLVDLSTLHADWLGDRYSEIDTDQVAEVRAIHYAAADGMDIPAYLTLPKGREARDLPLIVLPHGGPAARDEPGFDWWSQALAARGYAVLQPQFRGSGALGSARLTAGYGQWGRKMQTDLSDGVRALAKQGLIDSKRVCIVGGSYGGYAALAGVTLDPGVYRCAVSLAGISDLKSFLGYEQDIYQGKNNPALRYWDRFLGISSPSDAKLDALSPARLADKVTVPVLLIHGRDDTVVPFDQSTRMEQALKRLGKPVELVTLKSEDHWLSRSATRLQMLQSTVAFLETNNPPH